MTIGVRLLPENLRSIDSSTFTGLYQAIGTAFQNPASLIKIVNNSTVAVTISWDGVNDHDFIPATSFALYDITANSQRESGVFISEGTIIYVKGSAGVGSVYLVDFYTR